MDAAMQLVEKHCGKYMQMYSTCVDTYPDTWHLDCELSRVKLAKCADSNSVIVDIKMKCAERYDDYEKCLMQNPIHVQKCFDKLKKFNSCANEVTTNVPEAS